MFRLLVLILALIAGLPATTPAAASEIVGALSQNQVSLTANFSGKEILIFGAVRNDPVVSDNGVQVDYRPFDIVVTVEGPRQPIAIWRKDRRVGLWVNVDSVTMPSVPSFYAVATTAPLDRIISPETDARFRISPEQAIRADELTSTVADPQAFTQALLRLRQRASQYLTLNDWVHLEHGILFRTNVQLPANLTEGAYMTRMYLVRDGRVVNQFRTAIFVRKEGFERLLYQMAFDQPLLYGLMALLIALIAGWGASALFRLVRHG